MTMKTKRIGEGDTELTNDEIDAILFGR